MALALAIAPAAGASSKLESIFQDDAALVNSGPDFARQSLDEMRGLGVRASTRWSSGPRWPPIATRPRAPTASTPSDPAAYDQARWAKWDTLVARPPRAAWA